MRRPISFTIFRLSAAAAIAVCATAPALCLADVTADEIAYGETDDAGLPTSASNVISDSCCPSSNGCGGCPNCNGAYAGDMGTDGTTSPSMDSGAANQGNVNLMPARSAALGSSMMTVNSAPGGYIDNPVVGTWFRLRYDDAFNNPFPDRAEFFYARYGGPGIALQNASPTKVNYQQLLPYFEWQIASRLSIFAEIPVERVNIIFDPNSGVNNQISSGLADMNTGFKYALYTDSDRYLTFQFRTYIPTGNSTLGLGTAHVSLEPALLYLRRMSNRAYFQGEFRDWIPVGGTPGFQGNVLRYGVGLGYDVFRSYNGASPLNPYVSPGLRITGVTEFVGWTVLNGQETLQDQVGTPPIPSQSAAGNTIVNLKLGVRVTRGQRSLYAGWGHPLTGDTWYGDLFRLEYRRMF